MIKPSIRFGLLTVLPLFLAAAPAPTPVPPPQPAIGHRAKAAINVDGLIFHDLDGDGRLTRYEDWRLPPEQRAHDLLSRMTLEEKAGLLMHGSPPSRDGGMRSAWDPTKMRPLIEDRHIAFFINSVNGSPKALAEMANAAQEVAEATRLGVPLTISSDPRNTMRATIGLSVDAGSFSLWPDPTGLAAIGDPALVRRFAEIAAAEYRAVGIRMALSPMADLATEPRWPRISGTFGDDPAPVARYVRAYVEGFQGGSAGIGRDSVAAVVKHWVGYGAEPGGYDAHNPYGRTLAFPGGAFAQHVLPFRAAFAANVAGVMPTYGKFPAGVKLDGIVPEQVGGGFNRPLLTDLLRGRYRFGGIVLTDWKITDDCAEACEKGTLDINAVGMPWGVERLSKEDRFVKALDAGVDQFGGVMDADIIVKLVREHRVSEARLDRSALRLLTLEFRLGLFENPYVDPDRAERIVGSPGAKAAAEEAQRRSLVLLKNDADLLPLAGAADKKVWLWNVSPAVAAAKGLTVVDRPEQADYAIVRIAAPYVPNKAYFFGARHHEGSLAYPADNPDRLAVERAARAGVPVIVSAYLDRPAILTPIVPRARALLADFGVGDSALLDVLLGKGRPQGHLPFELPSSAAAVERQLPDRSSDSVRPLFHRGAGLSYRR